MSAVWRHSTGGMVIVGDLLISMQRYPSRTAHTKSKDVQLGEDISSLSESTREKEDCPGFFSTASTQFSVVGVRSAVR